MSEKTVFLDRDGVINKRPLEHDYIKSWDEFEFLPGVPKAIRLLNENSYRTVIVSNQRGIARGLLTLEKVDSIHKRMQCKLGKHGAYIDEIYICPHEIGECGCRKPGIGLFLKAEAYRPVNRNISYMIGDSESDIKAGKNYGVQTILIGQSDYGQDMTYDSLLQAVKEITEETK